MASTTDEALDDSIPEMVYQCISLIDGTVSKREDSILKCPLCDQFGRYFYCMDCVRNGNFTHSKKKSFERFADKKPKKYRLDEERAGILKKYEEVLLRKKEAEDVKLNIIRSKEKIELLKQCISSCKEEIARDEKSIKALKERRIAALREKQIMSSKISRLTNYKNEKHADLEDSIAQLDTKNGALQTLLQCRINELTNHIFPIFKAPPQYHRNATSSEEGQCAELEEAQKTTYIQGQWVITGSPIDDTLYAVVEPLIPSNGDYSAYTTWCAEHEPLAIYRGGWSNLDRYRFDVAYGISAALAYASQLTNILAFYTDVHVPKRTSFNDFCRYEDATKFAHQVAKLNANIVHLCLHRQVDVSELSSHRTISNLLLLLDSNSKEKHREINEQEKEDVLESLEDSIGKDLLAPEESDDDIDSEFEHINPEEVPKTDAQSTTPTIFSSVVSSIYRGYYTAVGRR